MKWFQIRILHRIIGTNIVLNAMGLTNTINCTFCNDDRDSIHHFLWDCTCIQNFWNDLERLFNEKCENASNLRITRNIILFGFDEHIKTDSAFDFVILYAKLYIYKCKIGKCLPVIPVFLRELTLRYNIEKHNAKVTDNLLKFDIEWHYCKQLFLTENV